MTTALILVLKIGLISGFLSLVGWIAVYTRLAPWWRNPVGRTLVIKTALIAMLFVPSMLSLFFNLSRFDSIIVGWIDATLICAVTPIMIWRSVVWLKLYKARELPGHGEDSLGP